MTVKRKARSMMATPKKRRKSAPAIEEITFDLNAREDYLTGFHKRKLQRVKHAREDAAKREREEKIVARKMLREGRKADLEKHVAEVNSYLHKENDPESDESGEERGGEANTHQQWNGIEGDSAKDCEAEYMDEDRHTTVTVEAVDVSRDGLHKAREEDDEKNGGMVAERRPTSQSLAADKIYAGSQASDKTRPSGPKKRKKKFRYESKGERKVTRHKEKSKNSAKARDRKT